MNKIRSQRKIACFEGIAFLIDILILHRQKKYQDLRSTSEENVQQQMTTIELEKIMK
jgi:hypothetical protein